jgi:hypothetical protein
VKPPALPAKMPRPKPPEPFHKYTLRLPLGLWQRLVDHSNQERSLSLAMTPPRHWSINHQVREFVEAGLPGGPIVSSRPPDPADALPWLDQED